MGNRLAAGPIGTLERLLNYVEKWIPRFSARLRGANPQFPDFGAGRNETFPQ